MIHKHKGQYCRLVHQSAFSSSVFVASEHPWIVIALIQHKEECGFGFFFATHGEEEC